MNKTSEITPKRCEICEHFSGCRGECPGTDDGLPCTGFSLAEDRHGDYCPETGDMVATPACHGHGGTSSTIARITTTAAVTTAAALLSFLSFFSLAGPAEGWIPGLPYSGEVPRWARQSHSLAVAGSTPAPAIAFRIEETASESEIRNPKSEIETGQVPLLPGHTWRGSGASPRASDLADLLAAIRRVESGGNDLAVGDGGKSRGAYQITAAYWRDGCEYGGVGWDYHRLVWSRPHCEQVMQWYWVRHDARTDEQRARMHNGGPNGATKPATLAYWRRVRMQR